MGKHACQECRMVTDTCDRCGKRRSTDVGKGHLWNELPPPYGSFSSDKPLMVCGECHDDFITLAFEWAGVERPPLR